MKVNTYISELLFEHDCVIIPGFGGFVGRYAPAKIHPVQHTFSPPSKHFVFNSNLKNNDGLLANHLVLQCNISFTEASIEIKQFVDHINHQLHKGNKVVLDKIGTFYYDVERNIQFEPDSKINYLLQSFGLTAFSSPSIKRANHIDRLEKQFKDRVEVEAAEKPSRINIRKYVGLAIAASFLIIAVYVPLKTNLLKTTSSAKDTPLYQSHAAIIPFFTEDTAPNTLPATIKLNDKEIVVKIDGVITPVNESKPSITSTSLTNSVAGSYLVVGGCFLSPTNAENFALFLKEKGFSPLIINRDNDKLVRVCYGSFTNKKQAIDTLLRIRSIDANAWLMSN